MKKLRLEKYLTVKKFRAWDGYQMDYDPPVSLISTASVNDFFDRLDVYMQYLGLDTNLNEIYELDQIQFKNDDGWWHKGYVVDSENGMTVIYQNMGQIMSAKISSLPEYYITGKNYYEN